MQAGDPRADPVVVDLIELAGIWVAAGDWPSLRRTLVQLDDELKHQFPTDTAFSERFRELLSLVDGKAADGDEIRRAYRRASVG
jgi:hypothetical protein